MNKLNGDFLQEYAQLDALIKKKLTSDKGVSTYIEKMENMYEFAIKKVSNWESDYKLLKNLRWKRNQLAHEATAMKSDFVTGKDIKEVINFSSRVSSNTDPLSLIRNCKGNTLKPKIVFISLVIIVILFTLLCLKYM